MRCVYFLVFSCHRVSFCLLAAMLLAGSFGVKPVLAKNSASLPDIGTAVNESASDAVPLSPMPRRDPFAAPLSGTQTSFDTSAKANNQNILDNSALRNSEFAVLRLNYVKAEEAKKSLQGLVSGRLAADASTNSLLFCGAQADLQRLRQAAEQLDVATKQVTLEAKLIAVSCEDSRSTGINWSWEDVPQKGTDSTDYGGNFKFWHGYAFRFRATLNALLAQGKARILARPHLITLPGREAGIFIGDHIPVQTEKHDSSGTYTSTEYLDAGIKLQYTPIVSGDGSMVTATVHTEVSTPTLVSEIKNYKITSRTADTCVRMKNGETLVIGGLLGEEEQRSWQKVPLLGDLPLLGGLFRSRRFAKNRTEVLLLLTPHVTEAGASPAIYREADTELREG